MEFPKLVILLSCICYGFASEHSHVIPVEGYETELQDLGEYVHHHETPVKVIKITKTVAVKVPVPYPVKVVEKVPYPVHISKPYPVPVPHIVHVPQPAHLKHAHEPADVSNDGAHFSGGHQDHPYQVQEPHSHNAADEGHSFLPIQDSYNGVGHGHNEANGEEYSDGGSLGGSYDGPSQSYYGSSGEPNGESFESKSYDNAIQAYLQNRNNPHANSYH